ncbi:Cytospin-A [Geodia barretti]|uniref:Cytospin-A n=1 Tax=Geodia barretti TaxID=519541 RepID=A0AA35QYM2_GEOBA|nr:Cytospin-A [Geodia barretti]
MAETVLVTVTHSTVLDEPHDVSGGGQPARKKGDTGSKSPGKGSWRWGKGSLFKRTLSDQDVSQRAERPSSGKSKTRKGSHDGIGNESPSVGRVSSGSDILGLRPPDPTAAAEEGEGDKGKFGDPKKLYKQNKDLAKANAQLTKLIDTLKHEKDSLAFDRTKLKGDLKSTEKELKKAQSSLSSAKSEVERLKTKSLKHSGAGSNMGEGTEVLQERVRQLEAELSSRDEKLEKFRKRLGGRLSQLEILAGNGSIEHEATTEKQDTLQDQERQKLMEENSELRERVVNLESDLNVLLKMVDGQQKEEFAQSSSTEISFFSTDALSSTNSDLRRGSRQSTSPFSSPRNSPRLQRKNQTSDDIATLRSCLQLALEEKKAAEQQAKSLQTELDDVRAELEEAKRSWGQEKDRLLRQLLKAHEEKQRVQMQDHETQHSLTEVPGTPEIERNQQLHSQQQSETTSPTRTRGRTSSSGSLTSSSELEKSSESTKSDTAKPAVGERKETARGRKGVLKKQQSRENFTAALAKFQSGEGVTSPKKERRQSDTSPGSARSSTSPAPTPSSSSPKKLSTESRPQSVIIVGKPPIPPSSSSGHHSRQSSVDETGQKSPTKMSIGAKRSSWAVAQRRKSFEEQSPEPASTPCHSRTASSPVMTRTLGSPAATPKATEAKDKAKGEKKFDEERARRDQERRKQELEAEEKRKRELEAKRRREAEEKERQRKEKGEKERIRREKEERERQRKSELEEKSRREREEREKKRQEELEKKRKEEERERVRREREERERERKRELEEKTRREKEEREKKRREELERKRQLEQRKKEEEEEKERQKIEVERKRKEEQEAALKKQRKEEEQKQKQTEEAALKKQREEEIEKKLRLEEEKRNAEKAAQAAIDPLPSKMNQHQSPFGSIAMRRAAFEQNSNPRNSPPVVLRRNNSPAQRPKSMDISTLMSTPPPSSPVASPTPRSPQISSISVKSSKSPQSSPVPQRKEMKEVAVLRGNSIPKPSPPVTTVAPRTATVSVTTTSSSPPLRRAQTLTLTPASLTVSTPDLTSLGSSNGSSSPTNSPSAQHRTTVSTGPKSPQTDRRLAKTVSFSPNLSTAGRPPSILKQSAPSPMNTNPHSPSSSVNKMRFGPTQARLGVPADDMKKAQSLQNIPEHAMAEGTSPQTATRFTSASSHVTRRPRSERAKTTSLSSADATNLVNLISKLQEKEKDPPLSNGVSNSAANQKTPGFSSPGRPVSMYGSITPSRTDVIPSSRKPKPHERKMERRATVGFGLDRSSKKSRLLRWCQLVTDDYDNIYIGDFGKSFSNGLAFCAILHHFIPHKIPYSTLNDTDKVCCYRAYFPA